MPSKNHVPTCPIFAGPVTYCMRMDVLIAMAYICNHCNAGYVPRCVEVSQHVYATFTIAIMLSATYV